MDDGSDLSGPDLSGRNGRNNTEPLRPSDLCIVVACNSQDKLDKHVMCSDLVARLGVPVRVEMNPPSASIAYNRGLDGTSAPIVIFAHQDVYFPPGWEKLLFAAIERISETDPDWALLAPFGMDSETDEHTGEVWSSSMGAVIGKSPAGPVSAQSFDELVIVLRRASGLRFDERLPNFHLYGTDIVQSALDQGLGAYIVRLPLVHNDNFHDQLRADFAAAYAYIRRKWAARLPVRTPVIWIRRHGLTLPLYQLRSWRSVGKRRAVSVDPSVDPKVYSRRCGWE